MKKFNMEEVYNETKDFIDYCLANFYYFDTLLKAIDGRFSSMAVSEVYENFKSEVDNADEDFIMKRGASKIVFCFFDKNYVLKIPISSRYDNYCQIELNNYKAAVNRGIEECFAFCEKVMDYNSIPIYMMEYANVDEDILAENAYESYSSRGASEKYEEASGEEMVYEVMSYYYEENFNMVIDFLDEFNIGDLHSENIGFICGRPVYIDYSGWEG